MNSRKYNNKEIFIKDHKARHLWLELLLRHEETAKRVLEGTGLRREVVNQAHQYFFFFFQNTYTDLSMKTYVKLIRTAQDR